MPELPEVETTMRGITPHILHCKIIRSTIRQKKLRWPIADDFHAQTQGQQIAAITRRSKYLLIHLQSTTIIWHLGMSGSLRLVDKKTPLEKHEHVDIEFDNGRILRYKDPRRFGALLLCDDLKQLTLLNKLGPEPLGPDFDGDWLYKCSQGRSAPVKTFIMDAKNVVGVGNIYAAESLFMAGIHPTRPAGKISLARYQHLAQCIKKVLSSAIEQGGTSLNDFVQSDGQPGYFAIELKVYGRAGKACPNCHSILKNKVIGQRASVYCSDCQH